MLIPKTVLALISSGLVVYIYGDYIVGILKKRVIPHPFSWFLWGLTASIAFAAQLAQHGGAGAWPTGLTVLFCAAITLMGLRRGVKKITPGD